MVFHLKIIAVKVIQYRLLERSDLFTYLVWLLISTFNCMACAASSN